MGRHAGIAGGSVDVTWALRPGQTNIRIRITNNLGDAKSLVTHPATTTHQRLTSQARAELGITDGFVRFSAGLEHPDDLVGDLVDALKKA